jgi:hypothetical protein
MMPASSADLLDPAQGKSGLGGVRDGKSATKNLSAFLRGISGFQICSSLSKQLTMKVNKLTNDHKPEILLG